MSKCIFLRTTFYHCQNCFFLLQGVESSQISDSEALAVSEAVKDLSGNGECAHAEMLKFILMAFCYAYNLNMVTYQIALCVQVEHF